MDNAKMTSNNLAKIREELEKEMINLIEDKSDISSKERDRYRLVKAKLSLLSEIEKMIKEKIDKLIDKTTDCPHSLDYTCSNCLVCCEEDLLIDLKKSLGISEGVKE